MKQPLLILLAFKCIWPQRAFALDPAQSLAQYYHTRWTQNDGGPADIRAIAPAGDGLLWLCAAGGRYRSDGVRFAHVPLIPKDRTRSDQITCLPMSRHGTVWVGYLRGGLAIYRDGRLQPIDSPAEMVIAAGTSNLQIDFTAAGLSISERVRFRYRMESVDQRWVDPGSRRQAFHTKLGPGDYNFRVVAANCDGVWNNEGATLNFRIPPTFVQGWHFLALCVVTGGIIFWWLCSMRLRQVADRVRDRLEHRLAERERIARELHDTLLQGFQGLLLRFQAASDTIPAGHSARLSMESALDLAESVLGEGRDRVRDLRTTQSSESLAQDLSLAVARLVPDPTVAHVRQNGQARALRPFVRQEACRIGEEAIANAVRHAAATLIEIDIGFAPHQFSLSIADNGSGLDPDIVQQGQREGHFGLVGMRERSQQIKGELTISSRVVAGAEVSLVVPASEAYADTPGATWLRAFHHFAVPARLRR